MTYLAQRRVFLDGSQVGDIHKQEPKDAAGGGAPGTTQRYYLQRVFYEAFVSATTHTIEIDYRTDTGGDESAIWEATIELWRVS